MRLQSLMDASTTIHLLWKNTAKRNKGQNRPGRGQDVRYLARRMQVHVLAVEYEG